ncbi:MAG: ABC transporter substrate-binding protein [Sphingobacteriales bacterium]|nr:MAG: ABC transporter substrate-binding protein [Sphingobacteriales bacterium]
MRYYKLLILSLVCFACNQNSKNTLPQIGYVDAFEDATIAQAKAGFVSALAKNGFIDAKNIQIIYKNAQGSIPTLGQIVNYFVSENVTLLATSTTLATLTAIQKTKNLPIFMMVAPTPKLMKIEGKNGEIPPNLFGVAEDLNYIDSSFSIIPTLIKPKFGKLRIGMVYNQAEPQSVDALARINALATKYNAVIVAAPVNTSADAQLVTQFLLSKDLDCFFANPDNTVFSSFETILKNCNKKNIPIFTSEAGLVKRGALAAFGADMYQWGYQAGLQAAIFLKSGKTDGLKPEMVKVRKRVYNPKTAKKYGFTFPENFEPVK